jgi:ankyrin repeat protein
MVDPSALMSMMSPAALSNQASQLQLIQSDQYPDILQYTSNDQARSLIETLATTNNPLLINKQGGSRAYTTLHWICVRNDLDLIRLILSKCKDLDVNCKASLGETPLFVCIKNCNLNAIEMLTEHGADLTHRDVYNRSILHWTAYTGKVVLFHYFQKYHNINSLNDFDQFQQNPMHIAAASGFNDLIIYLLERSDVDIFAQDFNGNTCLHMGKFFYKFHAKLSCLSVL